MLYYKFCILLIIFNITRFIKYLKYFSILGKRLFTLLRSMAGNYDSPYDMS